MKRDIFTPSPDGGVTVTTRQQAIVSLLQAQGTADYADLADHFGVSTMTIRRDADVLAALGLVIKVIGGLQRAHAPSYLYETSLRARQSMQPAEKEAIAMLAIARLDCVTTLFLDGGTTCLALAKQLARFPEPLTVISNSSLVCMEAGRNPRLTVVCLGGEYDRDSLSFVGTAAEDAARGYFVDLAIVSTKGFLPTVGTFESVVGTYRIKQIIVGQAKRVMALVDHTKFGQRALRKVLDVGALHEIVTDAAAPPSSLRQLRRRGIAVHVANVRTLKAAHHDD